MKTRSRTVAILLGALAVCSTDLARNKGNASRDSARAYSVGDEIRLSNRSISLRVTVARVAAGTEAVRSILGSDGAGLEVTLRFENQGAAAVPWAFPGAPDPEDSGVILELTGGGQSAPVAESGAVGVPKGQYAAYKAGGITLNTISLRPGRVHEMRYLFTEPEGGTSGYVKIRQPKLMSRLGGPSLFPKEGILVRLPSWAGQAAKQEPRVAPPEQSAPAVGVPEPTGDAQKRTSEPEGKADQFRAACEKNDAKSCAALGVLYLGGSGVPRNLSVATTLLEKACSGGIGGGCNIAALMYDLGDGVVEDAGRAAQLMEKGCEAGDAAACWNAALHWLGGDGAGQNKDRGVELLRRACSLGEKRSCELIRKRSKLEAVTNQAVQQAKGRKTKLQVQGFRLTRQITGGLVSWSAKSSAAEVGLVLDLVATRPPEGEDAIPLPLLWVTHELSGETGRSSCIAFDITSVEGADHSTWISSEYMVPLDEAGKPRPFHLLCPVPAGVTEVTLRYGGRVRSTPIQLHPAEKTPTQSTAPSTDETLAEGTLKNQPHPVEGTPAQRTAPLADQTSLAETALKSGEEGAVSLACSKLTDQRLLLLVARNHPDPRLRAVAVKFLTAPEALAELLDDSSPDNSHARNAAAAKLAANPQTDQVLLAKIATTPGDWAGRDSRLTAVSHLTDQKLLTELVKTDSDSGMRWQAMLRLKDQTTLAEVARKDTDEVVRKAAAHFLTDQTVLAEIGRKDSDEFVREAAVEELTDQTALAEIVKTDRSERVSRTAIAKLNDQSALAEVARTHPDWYVRSHAVEKLTDRTVVATVLKGDADSTVRRTASSRLAKLGEPKADAEAAPRASAAPLGGPKADAEATPRASAATSSVDTAGTTREAHAYGSVMLTLSGVDRVQEWTLPMFRNSPDERNRKMNTFTLTERGLEIAVVRLRVSAGSKDGQQLDGPCTELVDINGISYKSPVVDMSLFSGIDHECPFAVPIGVQLKSFRMNSIVFSLK